MSSFIRHACIGLAAAALLACTGCAKERRKEYEIKIGEEPALAVVVLSGEDVRSYNLRFLNKEYSIQTLFSGAYDSNNNGLQDIGKAVVNCSNEYSKWHGAYTYTRTLEGWVPYRDIFDVTHPDLCPLPENASEIARQAEEAVRQAVVGEAKTNPKT